LIESQRFLLNREFANNVSVRIDCIEFEHPLDETGSRSNNDCVTSSENPKMLIPILITVGAIVLLFILIVAMQSSAFRIVRSATMSAPPSAVFEQVNDFHNWIAWSPWERLDPQMKRTYDGASSGVGAIYSWEGNKQVGQGRMTISESRPSELIRINLEFIKPFKATNTTEFTFQPQGSQTVVTWAMTGKKNFMFNAVSLFMNMDKLVGGDFEKGLANMKSVVEVAPRI
jgi:hypothetical protein